MTEERTIAVLPFEDLSRDSADRAWLSRGLAEDLITELSRFPQLEVIPERRRRRLVKLRFDSDEREVLFPRP